MLRNFGARIFNPFSLSLRIRAFLRKSAAIMSILFFSARAIIFEAVASKMSYIWIYQRHKQRGALCAFVINGLKG